MVTSVAKALMTDRAERVIGRLEQIARRDEVSTALLEQSLEQTRRPPGRADRAADSRRDQPGTSAALDSWQKFRRGNALDEQDIIRLESIILGQGLRPAFDILNGSYDQLPSIWQPLNDRRTAFAPLIASIGRIELTGHPSITLGGTAFVCGRKLVMTNRHAAETFVRGSGTGGRLSFVGGILPAVDFIEEVGNTESLAIAITAPILVLDNWDVAVLRLDGLPAHLAPLPMMASQPAAITNVMSAIIGYPGFDPRDSVTSQLEIFRGVFDKKRIQPGMLRGIQAADSFGRPVAALAHDCSTVGGNSGSALVAVDVGRVVGVHFGGRPAISNFSVPTWELASLAAVRSAGVEFTT